MGQESPSVEDFFLDCPVEAPHLSEKVRAFVDEQASDPGTLVSILLHAAHFCKISS